MSKSIDLNKLREIVFANQCSGDTDPRSPKQTLVVDRDANILTADTLLPAERGQVSRVQQDTFHAGWEVAEERIVRERMPSNTRKFITSEGVRGWHYSFGNEFGDTYAMFAYFDGSFYQVLVLHPRLEARYRSPHTGHIFESGRICMGQGMNSGRRTLADAYAKSVLWSNGISAMIHGNLDRFPFNFTD